MRGHSQWLFMPMWSINIIIIWYQLFFQQFNIFENIYLFGILFVSLYIPMAVLVGSWDYKKAGGNFQTEQLLAKQRSPVLKELFDRLDRIEKKLDN